MRAPQAPNVDSATRKGQAELQFRWLVFLAVSPKMASRKTGDRKLTRKMRMTRGGRATTNVFSQFDTPQVQEFKEAFNLIDQNRDGIIDKEDLNDIFLSLGKTPSEEEIEKMLSSVPCAINFTLFLTMFGEQLQGTDPEETIKNAFSIFDEDGSGTIDASWMRELLTTTGDQRLTKEQVDAIFRDTPQTMETGQFNYAEFARIIKYGVRESEDASPRPTLMLPKRDGALQSIPQGEAVAHI